MRISPLFLHEPAGNKTLVRSQARYIASQLKWTSLQAPPSAKGVSVSTLDQGSAPSGEAGKIQVTGFKQFVLFGQKRPTTMQMTQKDNEDKQLLSSQGRECPPSCTSKMRHGEGDELVGCSAAGFRGLCKVSYEIFHSILSQARGSCLQKGCPK